MFSYSMKPLLSNSSADLITDTNWGLLRAEELGWEDRPTGKVWELQSDSNSFDFFKGLLKTKS